MRNFCMRGAALVTLLAATLAFVPTLIEKAAYCQETTGGLQGTVKDPSGAVVPKAKVVITSPALVGSKELITDSSGYYRFANLPPGTYTLHVTAQGFKTEKRDGIVIGVGRLPSLDLSLQVGAETTTVEVSTEAPVIDTTTTENLTNIDSQSLQSLPTGTTFQSVIQFAPMARNEPLAGMSINGQGSGGTGGSMPGSSGNGRSLGYSIGGAADSESSYLVEGQDTENISGGYSKANVPMDFIDTVEMKTSGISAEYGGALGGVVNVVMRKGGNEFHGKVFGTYESSGTDGNPVNAFPRYDPTASGCNNTTATAAGGCPANTRYDPAFQIYQAQKDHFRTLQPGVLVGGPIVRDRLWFIAGFNPLYNSRTRNVDFGTQSSNAGLQYFTQDRQTYYTYGRLDTAITPKIRVYGSWLYQFARETGANLPIGDPIKQTSSFVNLSIFTPITAYSHGLGWSAPNVTYNVGADISLTQSIVSTTKYGYFFENYHDFGWPTSTPNLVWLGSGVGATDNTGAPLPANLAQNAGTTTQPYNGSYTLFNADKHYQFNQDIAVFKGGWWGTHNLKFGYQLNHLVNVINQNGNVPQAFIYPGSSQSYFPFTATGKTACAALSAEYNGPCAGQYGYFTVQDFATILTAPASDYNHALYVQDSWQVGKGVTLDLGLRIERESLPAPAGVQVKSIDFPWSDKVEPRLGGAWDPTRKGKMKIFGSYGVVNDVMKLLLAQTSWGAQAYEDCAYPLGPNGTTDGFDVADFNTLVFKNNRACPTVSPSTGANWSNGAPPTALVDKGTGVNFLENTNFRPWEPVAPGVKPYRQHEYVIGFDYEIKPGYAFEARYDRRRLDHVIEDSSLSDPFWGEIYTIVNPGEGVNKTIDGYSAFLTSLGEAFGIKGQGYSFNGPNLPLFGIPPFGTCPSCPPMPKAVRNYDGLEFRLTMTQIHRISGMFSYTWSSLWGNYTGLTTTDQTDGGITGRNSPDTTRSFDEPFYYYGASGKSTNGPLPTDRPNVLKGNVYYTLPWWKHQTTTIGLFQAAYQGSPVSSYIDLFHGSFNTLPYEATYVFGRGKFAPMTTDTAGNITLGTPVNRRTPWFTQSDLNLGHEVKVGDHESIAFEATALNVLNQRAITSYWASMDSMYFSTGILPGGNTLSSGAALYQSSMTGYDVQSLINADGVVAHSQYNQPYLYQNARSIRLGVHYTF